MPIYANIFISDHCKERQLERGISHQQKINTIKNPDGELKAREKRKKFWKIIDGSKLVVIIKEVKNGKAHVVTAYWPD